MKKIGEIVHHKSGVSIPFFLDRLQFVATCHGKTFTAPDAKTLETMVKDQCEHLLQLDWFPVIKVEFQDNDGWGNAKKSGLWIKSERMWLSRSPAGKVLSCEWGTAATHRKASAHPLSSSCHGRPLRLSVVHPRGAMTLA